MDAAALRLDAHRRPPEQLKTLFKKYQNATKDDLDKDVSIINLENPLADPPVTVEKIGIVPSTEILHAFNHLFKDAESNHSQRFASQTDVPIYEVQGLPGLLIIPSLLSSLMQIEILNRLLHRDLVDSNHKTNLHLHYDMISNDAAARVNVVSHLNQKGQSRQQISLKQVAEKVHFALQKDEHHEVNQPRQAQAALPQKESLFCADLSTTFKPKDPHVHKELSVVRALEKKLRWLTIGGQYDWTTKAYPQELPPFFPSDIAGFLKTLFPYVDPQAAILNFYSPRDTLSVHRDVSEECDRTLISLSFGCEAIFVVGNEDGSKTATMRLHSGDALLMSKPSRFAWHGVSNVLAGTCPDWLEDWPVVGENASSYKQWRGWMAGKRINLNVRQMIDSGISGCISSSSPK